jgi:anti-sigma-K factor RskA
MTGEPMDDDDRALAAELALGLLEGYARAAADRRAAEDPAFARCVAVWEADFAGLTDDLAPVPPSPGAKRAVFSRLFDERRARSPFWRGAWPPRLVTAASLVAVALFVIVEIERQTSPPGPLYTAEIASDAGDFRVVAVVDKTTDELFLTRTRGAAPAGRILQVWAHGPGEPAMSVGLWPEGDSVRLPMPPVIAAVEGTLTIGVSEEPPGGSPTGSPSGRVFGTVDIPNVTDGT